MSRKFVKFVKKARVLHDEAKMSKEKTFFWWMLGLRKVGFKDKFLSLEDGINDYVNNYLKF